MEMIERVKDLIADYLEGHNMDLVEITYRREQGGMCLRLLVDKPEGIKINECEELNNFLSDALDRQELSDEHYILEVSSPGLDRPICSDRDFERSMGKVLEISTYEPVDGKKEHEGKLIGMNKDDVLLESNGKSAVIPRNKIARAKRRIEF